MRCQHPRNLKDFQPKTSPAVLVISERLEAGKQVLISINLPLKKVRFPIVFVLIFLSQTCGDCIVKVSFSRECKVSLKIPGQRIFAVGDAEMSEYSVTFAV